MLSSYDATSHSYLEYHIAYGEEPKNSDPESTKLVRIVPNYPKYVQLQNGNQIPLPNSLQGISDGSYEMIFHMQWNIISRISYRKYPSQIPQITKRVQDSTNGWDPSDWELWSHNSEALRQLA